MISAVLLLPLFLAEPDPLRFERHDIDTYPGGYQVAVADLNGDGKLDVIALSTDADRVDWYRNPDWKSYPIARTARNIDVAPLHPGRDGPGRDEPVELAVASGFYFSESTRGGEVSLLSPPREPGEMWATTRIVVDPVVHRLRWGDLDGDGRPELIHAPIFGPGSDGARRPTPAHLWAFRRRADPRSGEWEPWKIDETLTVLHGIWVSDLDGDGRDEILTASFEGIHLLDGEGSGPDLLWRKERIAPGASPKDEAPGAARGTSEVVPGRLADGTRFLAAIEPWHGHQVVVYRRVEAERIWVRSVIDDALVEGHALVVADLDGDGSDEIVAGWRGGGGGLALYDVVREKGPESKDRPVGARGPPRESGGRFSRQVIDRGIAVEGAVAADLNGDGRQDLVVIAGRTGNLAWYENRTPRPSR